MRHYLGVARKLQITDEEIGTVESIVMAVGAGRVYAQFREAIKGNQNEHTKKQNHNH
jgi:hypothetical protein